MSLITINKVDCKDCYKCVRFCPVKAIRVVDGHAEVAEERCLGDASCLHVCPQHAKQIRSDVEIVRALLASGRAVIASVAPSAAGIFGKDLNRLVGMLKSLGFARVEETARTAEAVARAHAELAASGKPVITSSCPAIVSLVEKYYPHLTSWLAPVASPMIAHARLLREEHGADTAVVFLGPCVAKKGEVEVGAVDAALTFDEFLHWLGEDGVDLASVPPDDFDNQPVGTAELFPLLSGLLRTAGYEDEVTSSRLLTVSGLHEVRRVFDELESLSGTPIVEALACAGGCLQGPGASEGPTPWMRRQLLLDRVNRDGVGACPSSLACTFTTPPLSLPMPSEAEITAVLHRTGKHTLADEHNCGACGYETCREKAVAVLQGMAEAEMCIPYMRSRAESFAGVVIRSTPNGIVVADSALRVLDANPAFLQLFGGTLTEMIGRPLKSILDPSGFELVRRTGQPFGRHEVSYDQKVMREKIFPVADEEIIIGIYVDVTDEVAHQQQLATVRQETLQKAQQVIDKQMRVAQEIAGLLGETTAETKVLLTRLTRLSNEENRER